MKTLLEELHEARQRKISLNEFLFHAFLIAITVGIGIAVYHAFMAEYYQFIGFVPYE